jgi:hypothetical protein
MSKARDLATFAGSATTVPNTTDVANLQVEDIMDSK